jgi:hypothetical protein
MIQNSTQIAKEQTTKQGNRHGWSSRGVAVGPSPLPLRTVDERAERELKQSIHCSTITFYIAARTWLFDSNSSRNSKRQEQQQWLKRYVYVHFFCHWVRSTISSRSQLSAQSDQCTRVIPYVYGSTQINGQLKQQQTPNVFLSY